ncbi:cell wall hydrolase [Rhodothermus marinus]|uniref:cell wall hydrolase n=1 Tax=Rhodothermus marinus TaxID=29549 RepID=UPI000A7CCC2B|nr:cell wall hydrolase [Rhodothermus marinus]
MPPEAIDSETLWLARVIYSETKRPEEMELVAWVVRNRVETRFRGKATYRDVVLDPFQFSAFIPYNPRRQYYMRLTPHSRRPAGSRRSASPTTCALRIQRIGRFPSARAIFTASSL